MSKIVGMLISSLPEMAKAVADKPEESSVCGGAALADRWATPSGG